MLELNVCLLFSLLFINFSYGDAANLAQCVCNSSVLYFLQNTIQSICDMMQWQRVHTDIRQKPLLQQLIINEMNVFITETQQQAHSHLHVILSSMIHSTHQLYSNDSVTKYAHHNSCHTRPVAADRGRKGGICPRALAKRGAKRGCSNFLRYEIYKILWALLSQGWSWKEKLCVEQCTF